MRRRVSESGIGAFRHLNPIHTIRLGLATAQSGFWPTMIAGAAFATLAEVVDPLPS
jgi:hypothetical protein